MRRHAPLRRAAFVRSLNILLKFARMYDFGHPRTAKQYETAWTELRTALGTGTEMKSGVLLAVSSDQLLLDGTALESAQAEKSFARMLSSAGIASIHFAPKVTQASLARFVRAFPTGTGAKPVQLAEQLKAALQGDPHIHVNEVCFVPADSAVAKSTVAAQLAARTLGMNAAASDELFNDPEKIAAIDRGRRRNERQRRPGRMAPVGVAVLEAAAVPATAMAAAGAMAQAWMAEAGSGEGEGGGGRVGSGYGFGGSKRRLAASRRGRRQRQRNRRRQRSGRGHPANASGEGGSAAAPVPAEERGVAAAMDPDITRLHQPKSYEICRPAVTDRAARVRSSWMAR